MNISFDSDTSLADRVYLALDDAIPSGQMTVNGRAPSHLQRALIKAMQKPLEILNDEELFSDVSADDLMVPFKECDRIVAWFCIQALEARYLVLPGREPGV